MAAKTMLRQLISKWGVMSIEMQSALENDGKRSDGSYADSNVLDADFVPAPASQPVITENTEEVMDIETDPTAAAEEYEAEAPKPKRQYRKRYPCPQMNDKLVPESECNSCSYRNGCPAHDPDPAE